MIKKYSKWVKNDEKVSFYEIRITKEDMPVIEL